jgi:hypothetical protein
MNDGSGGRGGLVWRWWRRAGVLAIVAGLAVLAVGCGSGPSPGRGSYSACMRKHGVTGAALASLPGMSSRTSMPASSRGTSRGTIPARVSAALQACMPLAPLPGPGSGPG